MQIILRHDATGGTFGARAVIRLAAGTLARTLEGIDPGRAFRTLGGVTICIETIRLEQAGPEVAMESLFEPGPVEHSEETGGLAVDVAYNEINMVLDRVATGQPGGRSIPASRDFLDAFTGQAEAAMAAIIAWCDANDAWADRDYFSARWNAGLDALRAGQPDRPHEFALSAQMRDALDGCWSLAAATPLEEDRFEALAQAYLLLRDAGWEDAEYEADPDAEPTAFGQPARLANFADNIASAPPPDARHGYTPS